MMEIAECQSKRGSGNLIITKLTDGPCSPRWLCIFIFQKEIDLESALNMFDGEPSKIRDDGGESRDSG